MKKRKKATHKNNYPELLSKLALVDMAQQEIIDSSFFLDDLVKKARQDSINRIEYERNDHQELLSLLNERISEKKYKEIECRLQELKSSFLLKETASSTELSIWFQQDIMKETSKLYFKYIKDSEKLKINHCGASICNFSILLCISIVVLIIQYHTLIKNY